MTETRFDNIRNRLWLTLVVSAINYLLLLLMDKDFWTSSEEYSSVWYYVGDLAYTLLLGFIFVELSVRYSRWLFRYVSFQRKPYRSLLIHTLLLLLLNNLTAFLFSLLMEAIFSDGTSFFHQNLYVFSVIVTFISGIYTNARYMESYIASEKQRETIEMNLLKEKETATRMQLEALKAQIDPHFMFNNFSILSELIVEDQTLAGVFLENISKVYRYVIQNLKKDVVTIREETAFLRSYIYLIKIRYENAIHVVVDSQLEKEDGNIPPVCLQLLVENAIKHNRLSQQAPLTIRIYCEEDYVVVENELRPIVSNLGSTGIGLKNIIERYSLLSTREPVIEKRENSFIVKLPIIYDYEDTDLRR